MITAIVAGSGSLARHVCHSLAVSVPFPVTVHVLARRPGQAAEVACLAGMRATLSGSPVRFTAIPVSTVDSSGLRRALAGLNATVLINCASEQSPWERLTAPSAWTELVRRAGFGLTLPLQAEPALTLATVLGEESPRTRFVNACFPDSVNPLVRAVGLPVLCGIGNVMLLAAALRATLPDEPGLLRVVAHHAHLNPPDDPRDEALAWLDETPLTDVTARLAALRGFDRRELNSVTGHAAALLLSRLLSGEPTRASVPGPLGLAGGYPVRFEGGRLELDLPPGCTEQDAQARNHDAALRDGVVVSGTEVRFAPKVQDAIAELLPDLAPGFPVTETEVARARLLRLRDRLRAMPPTKEDECPLHH